MSGALNPSAPSLVDSVPIELERSMAFPEKILPAYDHMDAKKAMGERNGTQAGDPPEGAMVMYELAVMRDPPL